MSRNEKREWLDDLCEKHHIINTGVLTTPQLEAWLAEYNQTFGGMCSLESFKRRLRESKRTLLTKLGMLEEGELQEEATPEKEIDEEIIVANVKYQKQKQRFQDSNRIERKAFREYARIENAVSEYGKELVDLLKEEGKRLSTYNPPKINTDVEGEIGLIQLTDLHLNELIDLPHNKYDFRVASHRLFKLCKESISMFKARGIKKIVVALTSDVLNSDRRLTELMLAATNRSKATFMSVDILKHFLQTLTEHFHVSVVSVLGNESRVGQELTFANETLSDSYDFVITNMLRLLFEASGNENITFGSLDKVETIIELNGHKILLTHDIPKATATQKGTQSLVGKYYLQGAEIDLVIGGHIHSTNIQDYGFRSASLCGANAYSDNALHLASRAGQNIYFFGKGYRHAMSMDLQNYVEGECFDIEDSLMEYHAKSLDKIKSTETIMSIVI